MQNIPNYDDIYRASEPSDLTKALRVVFTGMFVAAVFIVPPVTALKFFI